MSERQRSWVHSFACAWHDGEPCTCKDASDRPLKRIAVGQQPLPLDELRHVVLVARAALGVEGPAAGDGQP